MRYTLRRVFCLSVAWRRFFATLACYFSGAVDMIVTSALSHLSVPKHQVPVENLI